MCIRQQLNIRVQQTHYVPLMMMSSVWFKLEGPAVLETFLSLLKQMKLHIFNLFIQIYIFWEQMDSGLSVADSENTGWQTHTVDFHEIFWKKNPKTYSQLHPSTQKKTATITEQEKDNREELHLLHTTPSSVTEPLSDILTLLRYTSRWEYNKWFGSSRI